MSEATISPILRRVGAVFTGLLAIVALSVSTDVALHAGGVFPARGESMSEGLFVLATGYRTLFGVLGGYIAARLAPDRPLVHALALGIVGLASSIAGAVAARGGGAAYGPSWYPIALVVLALPSAWAGGRLLVAQRAREAEDAR